MKNNLTSAPMLTLLKGTKAFVLYCGASQVGMGCFVMQHSKVITYLSRQLKVHNKNYPTHDLHLTAVVFALKIWSHYLCGVHIDVFTDHKTLKYMFTQTKWHLRQRIWLEIFNDYDMTVFYNPFHDLKNMPEVKESFMSEHSVLDLS